MIFTIISIHLTKFYSQTPVFDLEENFSSNVSSWGFTSSVGTQTQTYDATNKLLQVRWANGSSEHIKTLSTEISPGTDNKITVDFTIKAYTSANASNFGALYLLDANGNAITGFHLRRGSVGGANKWFVGRATSYPGSVTFSYPSSADPLNADQPTAHIKFILDFNTKTLSFSAQQGTYDYSTRVFTASGSVVSSTEQAFINSEATNIKSLSSWYYRAASTSGTNGYDLMYAGISASRMVSTADVTINYLDQNGDIAKSASVTTGKPVGLTYAATADDKLSFTADGYYYAFDAANTLADHVIVAEGGSAINLKFKKTPLTTGTYNWTGTSNGNWNETDENFSTDGVNALGFQNSNAVAFTASGANKSINLSGILNIGEENITLEGEGYTFSGSGILNGTGAFILNSVAEQTTSLNITNNLTGGVVVNGGTAVILKDAAATRLTLANGASANLSTGAAFSKGISGTGTISLIPTSNVTYTSAITGAQQLNYSLASAGAVTAGGVFSAMPVLNNVFAGSINVNTTLSEVAMFGSTNSFADNKLALGNNVMLVYPVNPASDGTTTVAIGELSGSTSSKIMGPRLRNVNYNVGSLGTNSVFEGTIQNFAADQWSNIPVINFAKSGAGELTLSGESTQYTAGAATVNAGTLNVTGALGNFNVPVTVADGATLRGTGTIGGTTVVNGTLKGKLKFGTNLTLAKNIELIVNGFTEGEYDVVDVTGILTNGGTLKVISNASAPANNTSIQLLKASSYSGTFTVKDLPEHYSFDEATGYLTYNNLLSALEQNNDLRIYPALTRGEIFVTGAEVLKVEVCNMTGNVLHKTNGNTTSNVINISNLSSGAYILRVTLANGETKIQKVLLNK